MGAIGAGILTGFVIYALFTLIYQAGKRNGRSQMRRAVQGSSFQPGPTGPSNSSTRSYQRYSDDRDEDETWKNWDGYETPVDRSSAASPATAAARETPTSEPIDDWGSRNRSDDWEEFGVIDSPRDRPSPPLDRQPRNADDRPPEPKTAARSGSTYAYGYRDPQNTGVGKTETVVDADYRVIVPPYTPPATEPTPQVAEDWFDDDDLETDEERERRLGL